jgi:hypothetical protein
MTAPARTRRPLLSKVVFIALLAGLLIQSLSAASLYFVARFRSSHLSVRLEDPNHAFALLKGGIHRTGPTDHRYYITTARSDYLAADWTYEITFRTPPNAPDDLLFIGIGEAAPDPTFYDEPSNSLNFRIHQGIDGFSVPGWRVDVAAHDEGMFSFTSFHENLGILGGPEGGTFMARIRKHGAHVRFEILGTDVALVIHDITSEAPFLINVPTRIFFGNASGAYLFSDMRVLPEAAGQ